MQAATRSPEPVHHPGVIALLDRAGRGAIEAWTEFAGLLSFIGEAMTTLAGLIVRPQKIRWTSVVAVMEEAGLDALPIVSFLSFFIGLVIAFLGANLLAQFGAALFVVELVAFAMLREFGVVLTGILLAGRTDSAFTAQIGSMKMRQEIDAMKVMGLDPMEVLVAPRLIALVVMAPLLSFAATVSGIVGGMIAAWLAMNISPSMFLNRFQDVVLVQHFWTGLLKAPVIAIVIALVGCRQGLLVEGDVQSLGRHTTAAVVHVDLPRHRDRCRLRDHLLRDGAVSFDGSSDARREPGARPEAGKVAIRVRGLTNRFGSKVVHEDLDLDVYAGETIGVVGPSGTGKSVLLNTIVGLNKPQKAEIEVFGQRIDKMTRDQRLSIEQRWGVMFQDGALFSTLSVRENVMAPMREHLKLPRDLMRELADMKIRLTGLEAGRRQQEAGRSFRRHAQAGRHGARAGARSRSSLPRRTDRRPRPDQRGALRRTGQFAEGNDAVNRLSRDPRPRHAGRHMRPHRCA